MVFRPIRNAHLAAALHWAPGEAIDGRTVAIAALGMAVPAVMGLLLGQPAMGFMIGLGAMLLAGGTAPSDAATQDTPSPGSAILPAALAVIVATAIAGWPWTDLAMIALAAAAAAVSGYSRPLGVAAIRFIIYLVLSVSLLETAVGHHGIAALIFGLGALWNVAIRVLLARRRPPVAVAEPARTSTAAQRRAYWRRTLRDRAGWQFPVRLSLGLGAASLLRHLWPAHHYGWILVTVALLTQRPLELVPVKITQRALGTAFGVAITWVILRSVTAPLGLAALICLLATAAPLARSRNYLAYSMFATPVILMVMDIGKPIETVLLTDRLVATALAAVIVIAVNLVVGRWLRKPVPAPATPAR